MHGTVFPPRPKRRGRLPKRRADAEIKHKREILYDPLDEKDVWDQQGAKNLANVQLRMTVPMKEAILLAAKKLGRDGQGELGLTGYFMFLGREYPPAFAALLGKVFPHTVHHKADVNVRHSFRTLEEVRQELVNRGLPLVKIFDE